MTCKILRLRPKNHAAGNLINGDSAAVADTTSGNVMAIDPSWIFTVLYS